jgi:hypothetical protein
MQRAKGWPTILCPACKTRMSLKQIAHTSIKAIDQFIYHCPMCDIEVRQEGPFLRSRELEPAVRT